MRAQDDPKACADCTYYVTVLTSSGQPVPFDVTVSNARGHTLLTRGALVRSTVERDESALFKTYTYAGWDKDLVITVRAERGRRPRRGGRAEGGPPPARRPRPPGCAARSHGPVRARPSARARHR